ncbi:hypothetical protein MTR67_034904, partial [Solanum verrucosum]
YFYVSSAIRRYKRERQLLRIINNLGLWMERTSISYSSKKHLICARSNETDGSSLDSLKELILQRGESYLAWQGGVLPAKYVLEKHVSLLLEELWAECQRSAEDKLLEILEKESLLYSAAKAGNIELLVMVIHSHPELTWQPDYQNWTIFHVAGRAATPSAENWTDADNNDVFVESQQQLFQEIRQSVKEEEKIMPPSFLRVSGAALQAKRDSGSRDVRMDKNIMMETIELNNATASDMTDRKSIQF